MNVFLDLRLHLGGNAAGTGILETTKDEFFDTAFVAARPGLPVHVYRDKELTDLFATVWDDGGIDYRR